MEEEYTPIGSLPLFSNPKAATPAESRRASQEAQSEGYQRTADFAGNQMQRVLKTIQDAGRRGITRHEIADVSGISLQSVCARVKSLLDQVDAADRPASPVFIRGKRNGRSVLFAKGYC